MFPSDASSARQFNLHEIDNEEERIQYMQHRRPSHTPVLPPGLPLGIPSSIPFDIPSGLPASISSGMVLYEGKLILLNSLSTYELISQISYGPTLLITRPGMNPFNMPDMYSFTLRVQELRRRISLGLVTVPKHPRQRKVFFIHGIGLDRTIYDELEQQELVVKGTFNHCLFLLHYWHQKKYESIRAFTLLVERKMHFFPQCLIPRIESYF